jgi:hypothetical protein
MCHRLWSGVGSRSVSFLDRGAGSGDFAILTRVGETAHGTTRDGTPGAAAPNAVERTLTIRELADEPERRRGYPPTCGNSSWTRSTPAGRSGRYCAILT